MFGVSSLEFFVIVFLVLIAVGPKQLPDVLRTFGRAYRVFQRLLLKTRHFLDDALYDSEKLANRAEHLFLKEEKEIVLNQKTHQEEQE